MGQLVVGDVVIVTFPYSDLTGHKLRPALVLAIAEFDNLILCQITSKPYASKQAISLTKTDFRVGGLPIKSYIRPDKLFTAEPTIIKKIIGQLKPSSREKILSHVRDLF